MKVLIISDNHGDKTILDEIKEKYQDQVDGMIHCGDSELNDTDNIWETYQPVEGNCDYYGDYPTERIVEIGDASFLVVHGHRHRVKQDLSYLAEAAQQKGLQFAFYGHTHIPKVDQIEDVYVINPGSIAQPRYPYSVGTYAILEWTDTERRITYYDRDHQAYDELSQEL